MKFFLPKQLIFFDLLKELGTYLKQISDLFTEMKDSSFDNLEKFSHQAKEIENKADSIAHKIIDELNKTFITPIDREDIYMLAHEVDDIIDLIENAINNIRLYEIKEKKECMDDFASIISRAADATIELIDHLPKLENSTDLQELNIKIHELEDQGDIIFQNSIKRLFQEENDVKEIVKWKDILENLERIMDKYQRASNTIQGIIVKSQ